MSTLVYYLYREQLFRYLMPSHTTHRYWIFVTPLVGITGCCTILYGMFESATHYIRPCCYSPKNHFISELGLAHASSMAQFFDHSIMLAGLLLLLFIVGLGSSLNHNPVVRVATFVGMGATLSFSAVGHYTADHWTLHKLTAILFFTGTMVSMALFSFEMWRHREPGLYHPVISMVALLTATLYVVVLLWPKATLTQYVHHPDQFARPALWPLTVMEWSYCLLICVWIVVVSFRIGSWAQGQRSHQRLTGNTSWQHE